jgi:hypothetical protein
MNVDPAVIFTALQHRQDLHDRLYRSENHVLSRTSRLAQLVLHHCKHVAQLHVTIREYGIDGEEDIHKMNFRRVEQLAVDGIIACLSMMNCCNHKFGEFADSTDWEKDDPLNLLIRNVGLMSEAVEYDCHIGLPNPMRTIVESTEVMLTAYFKLFASDGSDLERLRRRIHVRLTEVEMKNVFYDYLSVEMDKLLKGG